MRSRYRRIGGVIGINRTVDEETAREVAKLFVEAIAAPDYAARGAGDFDGQEESAADEGGGRRRNRWW